jgi:hypothetical protein
MYQVFVLVFVYKLLESVHLLVILNIEQKMDSMKIKTNCFLLFCGGNFS